MTIKDLILQTINNTSEDFLEEYVEGGLTIVMVDNEIHIYAEN